MAEKSTLRKLQGRVGGQDSPSSVVKPPQEPSNDALDSSHIPRRTRHVSAIKEESLASSSSQLASVGLALATDPKYFWLVGAALLIFEAFLSIAIIQKVRYTNIDWQAYMQQVEGFLSGQRDYVKLEGDTGPIVYPGGFLYIYTALHWLTSSGKDIRIAQYAFAALDIVTLAVVMAIYRCSSLARKSYVLVFLTLSKRLHSIYVLRLFNDPVAMLPLYLCMLAMLNGRWGLATVLYSAALSIKMNILLFAPGFALLTYQAVGLRRSIRNAASAVLIQVFVGLPFLLVQPRSYLSRSFDFSRAFFYKWTVNWRFIDEDTFLSKPFAKGLLLLHVGLVAIFLVKWTARSGGIVTVVRKGLLTRSVVSLDGDYILTVMFTTNLIGIICARSLHYQFWSWYAHTVPYLLWGSRETMASGTGSRAFRLITMLLFLAKVAVMVGLEYAWNTYPSTPTSSLLLLLANATVLARSAKRDVPTFGAATPGKASKLARGKKLVE